MSRTLAATIACLCLAANVCLAEPSLKEAYADHFLIGATLNPRHVADSDGVYSKLIPSQFNTITAENIMKWGNIRPAQDRYRFEPADSFVEYGERHGMFIVGHTLVWHSQTPRWVFQGDGGAELTRDGLLERMRDHINTVVGRYKGRVHGWDVVNEALNDDGSLRDSPWRRIIGDDFILKAFEYAHAADPDAELYYNDYGIENRPKRRGAVRILRQLLEADIPVTGVGIQNHCSMEWPTAQLLDEAIAEYGALGIKVMITELDVDVLPRRQRGGPVSADIARGEGYDDALNPYRDGLPDEMQERLARRYAEIFSVYLKHADVLSRVTFWGVTDATSWLNNFPIRGRTNYPLLFDRQDKPKPAYHALIELAASTRAQDATEEGQGEQ